jgi:YidC/Oxa1 family membrane protein insertase
MLSNEFIWKKKQAPVTQPNQTTTQTVAPVQPGQATTQTQAQQSVQQTVILPDTLKTGIPINNNIVLQNDTLKVVFSNEGAVIREVYLFNFKDVDRKSPVQLINTPGSILGTQLNTIVGTLDLNKIVFAYELFEQNGLQGIRFHWDKNGTVLIEKKFILMPNNTLDMQINNVNYGQLNGYQIGFGGIRDTEHDAKVGKPYKMKGQDFKFIGQIDNTLESFYLSRLKEKKAIQGKVNWASIRSKYFLLGLIPDKNVFAINAVAYDNNNSPAFDVTVKTDTPRTSFNDHYFLYLGPVKLNQLKQLNVGMENAAERGAKWLRWLYTIFNSFLSWLFKLIPNYGIVIIIFSIILKIVLHPLTHKSMESGIKMQQIQPLIREAQAKYKSDPKRMQQELSAIYKENGVNPVGGCLPLILQMPIFIALYSVLRFSLDMRQAYFVGWLNDLSAPDPIYILPVLMGIFMFIQSKMMQPKTKPGEEVDEKQAAMMQSQKMMTYMMPIMMFFIFKSMPAGLVLYWTVFNILSIIQQYYLQKHFLKKAK